MTVVALAFLWCQLCDHVFCASSVQCLKERAVFLYRVRRPSPGAPSTKSWLAMMIIIGGVQLLVRWHTGSDEGPFDLYGFIYGRFSDGDWWRAVTGPFLHYSAMHFIFNACLLVFAGMFASFLFGYFSISAFLLISIFSGVAQWAWGPHLLDSFGGVSGGVYGLFGMTLGAYLARPTVLPRDFAVLILNSALLGMVSSALLSSSAANYAHATGALLGVIGGWLTMRFGRQPSSD